MRETIFCIIRKENKPYFTPLPTAEKIELGKQEDREVTFLELNELNRSLEAPKGNDLSSLRDRAILNTLFSTGMRVSELCSLDRDKIDIGRGELSIRGKGGKIRLIRHLKKHHKDNSSRTGLLKMVAKRRKLLHYLKREDPKRHISLVKKLGLK